MPVGNPSRTAAAVREGTKFEGAERTGVQLRGPVAEHLNRAFTDAFNLAAEKVTREIVENTLSAGFDSLDAQPARIGYRTCQMGMRFHSNGGFRPSSAVFPSE